MVIISEGLFSIVEPFCQFLCDLAQFHCFERSNTKNNAAIWSHCLREKEGQRGGRGQQCDDNRNDRHDKIMTTFGLKIAASYFCTFNGEPKKLF